MTTLTNILKDHALRYPLMQPCDAVKLVYQAVFGGGHMITDEKTVHNRLCSEYEGCSHTASHIRIENLGNFSRLYIDCELSKRELSLISRIFCVSAKRHRNGYGDADEASKLAFEDGLSLIEKMTLDKVFRFGHDEFIKYLSKYREAGYPIARHSDTYRSAYTPAYRVIDSRYIRLLPVIMRLDELMDPSRRTVLAIDGRCASGKSTAAMLICDIFDGDTVHMDDFFLPPQLRTDERLSEIGGNLHRERFIEEVIPHLRDTEAFTYRRFICGEAAAYSDIPRQIRHVKLIVCEGSYALHPDFDRYFDISVFSDVSKNEQIRRIRERDGEFMLKRFVDEWIPMEEQYFERFSIREKCDYTV